MCLRALGLNPTLLLINVFRLTKTIDGKRPSVWRLEMWKWTCPKSPNVINEHHTLKGLELTLTAHEDGTNVPGFFKIPGCEEIHNYWDDGVPCSVPGCRWQYIPDPNGPDID